MIYNNIDNENHIDKIYDMNNNDYNNDNSNDITIVTMIMMIYE